MTADSLVPGLEQPPPGEYVAPLLPASAPAPPPARPVNFFKALLLFWLRPRRYGPHLAVGPLRRAILAHVLAVLPAVSLGAMAYLHTLGMADPADVRDLRLAAAETVVLAASTTSAQGVWLLLLGAFGAVASLELAVLLLAVIAMPWAAGGDRARSVFKRSLKNVYWSSTILLPLAVVYAGYSLYATELREWQERDNTFVVPALMVGLPLVAVAVVLRMLLTGASRYVGEPDGPAFRPREPRCDQCGYLIIGLPLASDCPECGLAVRHSLPGGRRQPTDWQRYERRPRGVLELLHMQGQILRAPDYFRRLPVQTGLSSARHFWWGTYVVMLLPLLGAVALMSRLALDPGRYWGPSADLGGVRAATLLAVFAPLALQSVMMSAGCAFGKGAWGIGDYRVSAIVCLYASPLMWPLILLGTIALLTTVRPVERWLAEVVALQLGPVTLDGFVLMVALLASLALASLAFWWLRLHGALRAVRFANV